MKIWLDSTALRDDASTSGSHYNSDCDCDCDCDSVGGRRLFLSQQDISPVERYILSTALLRQANSLHQQPCPDRNWLVCNTSGSGAIAVLDAPLYDLFTMFRDAQSLTAVLSLLEERDPQRISEGVLLLYRLGLLDAGQQSPVQETSSTLTAWLHVTNACNLGCSYCYIKKTTAHMENETAIRAIDAIFRSASLQHFQHVRLKYAGGEASLRIPHVLALHDYAMQVAQQHDIALGAILLSNGVVLPQKAIDGLKQRNIHIAISLDGINASHDRQRPLLGGQGSFKYVDATIRRLQENGIAPHISVTVSQCNLAGLPTLLQYILDLDLPFSLSYYRDNDYALDPASLQFGDWEMIEAMRATFQVIEQRLPPRRLLDSLIDKATMSFSHQHTCGVGSNYLVIDQRGNVAKCHADIKHTVTTVATRDPLRVLQEDRRGIQNLSVDEKEGCRTCDWRYWCGGGCPLLTHRVTGRYDIKSPNCHIYQALFPDALRLEGLRLLRYETPIEW